MIVFLVTIKGLSEIMFNETNLLFLGIWLSKSREFESRSRLCSFCETFQTKKNEIKKYFKFAMFKFVDFYIDTIIRWGKFSEI